MAHLLYATCNAGFQIRSYLHRLRKILQVNA